MRILLVQDDAGLAARLTAAFESAAMSVEWTNNGNMAVKILGLDEFDATVIDLDMPDRSGTGMLAYLKDAPAPLPAIVLTAQDTLAHRVACLNTGADDFLSKPFAVEELLARLRAVVRRGPNAEYRSIACGPLTYDVLAETFALDGCPLALSRREHALLYAMIRKSGRYLPKQILFDRAFAGHEEAHVEAIEVLIHRLRKKLVGTPVRIASARGFGYRLETIELEGAT